MLSGTILRSESYGICPDREELTISRRDAVQSPPELGSVVSREINEREVRTFRLAWDEASLAERFLLLHAFNASFGGARGLLYTPVGMADVDAVRVRFTESAVRARQNGPDSFEMEAEVEEVL